METLKNTTLLQFVIVGIFGKKVLKGIQLLGGFKNYYECIKFI
jgi:hypothetical protein